VTGSITGGKNPETSDTQRWRWSRAGRGDLWQEWRSCKRLENGVLVAAGRQERDLHQLRGHERRDGAGAVQGEHPHYRHRQPQVRACLSPACRLAWVGTRSAGVTSRRAPQKRRGGGFGIEAAVGRADLRSHIVVQQERGGGGN